MKSIEKYKEQEEKRVWKLPKPKNQISEIGEKGCIMFFYGTFCPFHQGHVDTLKTAENYIRDKFKDSHEILSGYVSPCHP